MKGALFAILLALSAFGARQALSFTEADLAAWDFSLGREFAGAVGNVWAGRGPCVGQARLLGDFRKGGAYVAMVKNFADTPDAVGLAFSVQSAELSAVVFRATDSTGQTFQQKLGMEDHTNWQILKVRDLTGKGNGGNAWGGAKDGQWHGPLRSVAILVDRGNIRASFEKQALLCIRSLELELR